jgi:uncharacterized membrane protein
MRRPKISPNERAKEAVSKTPKECHHVCFCPFLTRNNNTSIKELTNLMIIFSIFNIFVASFFLNKYKALTIKWQY